MAFTEYYKKWLVGLEMFQQRLHFLSNPATAVLNNHQLRCLSLVDSVVTHFFDYFDKSAKATEENPLWMLSTPWMTVHERNHSWFIWFRPSVLFMLARHALGEDFEREKLEEMEAGTAVEEKAIEDAYAAKSGMEHGAPVEDWSREVGLILKAANDLREKTARGVLKLMGPEEAVSFFKSVAQYTSENRELGLAGFT